MKSNECLIVFECHACGNKARQKECKYFEVEKDGWCRHSDKYSAFCQCDEAKKDVLNEELAERIEIQTKEIMEGVKERLVNATRQCPKCGGNVKSYELADTLHCEDCEFECEVEG